MYTNICQPTACSPLPRQVMIAHLFKHVLLPALMGAWTITCLAPLFKADVATLKGLVLEVFGWGFSVQFCR